MPAHWVGSGSPRLPPPPSAPPPFRCRARANGKAKQHVFLDLPMSVVLDPTEDAERYAGAGTKGGRREGAEAPGQAAGLAEGPALSSRPPLHPCSGGDAGAGVPRRGHLGGPPGVGRDLRSHRPHGEAAAPAGEAGEAAAALFGDLQLRLHATVTPRAPHPSIWEPEPRPLLPAARLPMQWGTLGFHKASLSNLGKAMCATKRLCSVWLDTTGREMTIIREFEYDAGGWPRHSEPIVIEKDQVGGAGQPGAAAAAWRRRPARSVPDPLPFRALPRRR